MESQKESVRNRPKPKRNRTGLYVALPRQLRNELKAKAAQKGLTVTGVVNGLVEGWVGGK